MADAGAIRVAVEGCGHGTLNAIYASIEQACQVKGWDGIDVLIIGGDFQAVRNASDLNCMAVPVKYREIGDFHEYYSGARVAPYLTIFVGGNHEASNHLWELYYGGWVAPNIYYLGAANVVKIGPLRIAGLSGIWKGYNYKKSHYERLPYNQDDVRSIYHVRELDTRKLLQLRSQVDVGLSHDWPRGVEWLGDWKTLFRKKDLFEADARSGNLGSAAAQYVLERLRPPYWFSAHMHIKYAAVVAHAKGQSQSETSTASVMTGVEKEELGINGHGPVMPRNEEEIDLDMDVDEAVEIRLATAQGHLRNDDEIELDNDLDSVQVVAEREESTNNAGTTGVFTAPTVVDDELRAQLPASFAKAPQESITVGLGPPTTITNDVTRFLALDKCLPNRHFLQLLSINAACASSSARTSDAPLQFSYDPEWLAISRVFAHEIQVGDTTAQVSRDKGRAHYLPLIEKEEKWVEENITSKGKLTIPHNFSLTAPVFDSAQPVLNIEMPREYNSPQTAAFCALLDITNPFAASEEEIQARMNAGPRPDQPRGGGRGGSRRGGRGGGRGGHGDGGGRGFGRGGRGRGWGRSRGRG